MIEKIVARVDGQLAGEANNDVEAVIPLDAVDPNGEGHPYERHVKITHEGIVVDIVVDGEVFVTASYEHHDLLDWPRA
jgi:hypothetical protein